LRDAPKELLGEEASKLMQPFIKLRSITKRNGITKSGRHVMSLIIVLIMVPTFIGAGYLGIFCALMAVYTLGYTIFIAAKKKQS